MSWTDDDNTPQKAKRAVGRPVENPFLSPEIEEDFVRRGEAMLKLYYKEGGPNTRLNFVFGPGRAMSKTLFWSIIFVYYYYEKQLRNNVQGYLNVILLHFDPKVTSDRTSICQSVGLLARLSAHNVDGGTVTGTTGKQQVKYRGYYQFVVKRWQEVLTSSAACPHSRCSCPDQPDRRS